jgi:hypothetical protein
MSTYDPGDCVKAEFTDDATKESEWMWIRVEHSDDVARLLWGILDSVPIVFCERLKLGAPLAISYDLIREHRLGKAITSSQGFAKLPAT